MSMHKKNDGAAAEKACIARIGETLFAKLEAAAMLAIKRDARLCAADKIRRELAHEAALRAAGFPFRLVPPERPIPPEFQTICDEAMSEAVAAAEGVLRP